MVKELILPLFALLSAFSAYADELDPFDPWSRTLEQLRSELADTSQDESKSPGELVAEATLLMSDERLLDARTKLLTALRKDPTYYKAHLLLASYYMAHVGHYRLSLKYIRRAAELFEQQHGSPPFSSDEARSEHAQILYLLSQARLNLDDYRGSLKILDEYTAHGYYGSWYAGTRAWVLMKLGQLDEAIRVARLGIMTGAEPGRTLNMLGILLSMSGKREQSLEVFREAIVYETALGELGQPATPLNNSGEVYRETFRDAQAETAWIRSTGMKDGCEHVLPSLNLTLLYVEQGKYPAASRTLDSFESCVAQYPLRNGEEHKALVSLARGRIALYTGHPFDAIAHIESALQSRQWFGKIGTNIEDLIAGAHLTLAFARRAANNHLAFTPRRNIFDWGAHLPARLVHSVRGWWSGRRAREILIGDLKHFEDLYVRNTDSLLEYYSLGALLRDIPAPVLARRISMETREDDRTPAVVFYEAYRGENLFSRGSRSSEGRAILQDVLGKLRPEIDVALRWHITATLLTDEPSLGEGYRIGTEMLYKENPAWARNYGLALPVRFQGEPRHRSMAEASGFLPLSETPRSILSARSESGKLTLDFRTELRPDKNRAFSGEDEIEVWKQLVAHVFTLPIQKGW